MQRQPGQGLARLGVVHDVRHGPDGRGQTKMGKQSGAKDYTDPKIQAEFDDAKAHKSIKEGQKVNGKEAMKPFGDKLSDDEIKALIAHMRSFAKK